MNAIAVALGLWFAPALGAPLLASFNALGPDAVFGPGCSDDAPSWRTVQAPARWRRPPAPAAAILGPSPLTVMAEFKGDAVRSIHLSRQPERHMSASACRDQLAVMPGGAIRESYAGAVRLFERTTSTIARHPARYRALFRSSRNECRIMLTIGA